jgi:hypothetical protein
VILGPFMHLTDHPVVDPAEPIDKIDPAEPLADMRMSASIRVGCQASSRAPLGWVPVSHRS